eukprot:CAMPEP_0174279134 /NCGR_PEP_ID=MMETSP0439-20130205/61860_1 /TAXON_ID=0 /ORGANISM="Stereomyxa ramosa, Strain Chinc5" /LENGTH=59 /DNA_ID=CAMNT_0015371621 /DNA_START=1013 /DNA_END=1189 /DNA_ORIENTATION=-
MTAMFKAKNGNVPESEEREGTMSEKTHLLKEDNEKSEEEHNSEDHASNLDTEQSKNHTW